MRAPETEVGSIARVTPLVGLSSPGAVDRQAVAAAVEMEKLAKQFAVRRGPGRRIEAIADVSLSVEKGEFVSLIGPSGCGKSTLLRIIAGLEQPTVGRCTVRSGGGEGRARVAMCFQRPVLLPWLTVRENTVLSLRLTGRVGEESYRWADILLRTVGLGEFRDAYPWQLSGGMQQRNALAQALVQQPDVLLLDEPFGSLDALTREELVLELQALWLQTRVTTILVTHSIEEAVLLSDRVIVLSRRPARVVREVPIDLARPRSWELLSEVGPASVVAEVRRTLSNRE